MAWHIAAGAASVGGSATTGTVLMNNPTMVSTPASCCGRPATTVPNATVRFPLSRDSSTAHPNASTVLTVRLLRRAHSVSRAVSARSRETWWLHGIALPSGSAPRAASRVGSGSGRR